jgi:hypothetical protein
MSEKHGKLRVNFVLPGPGYRPVGRDKVIYEYANHLAHSGHKVTIVFSAAVRKDTPPLNWFRIAASYGIRKLTGGYHPKVWFNLDRRVSCLWVPTMHHFFIPSADVTFATSWETAEWIVNYPSIKGKKAYLIQGWEVWSGLEDRVEATWRLPFEKVFVSSWLAEIARKMGERYKYIPSGLDFGVFGLDVPN